MGTTQRRGVTKGRGAGRVVTPCVIFILTTNIAYQACRGLWRPQAGSRATHPVVGRVVDNEGALLDARGNVKAGLAANWVGGDTEGRGSAGRGKGTGEVNNPPVEEKVKAKATALEANDGFSAGDRGVGEEVSLVGSGSGYEVGRDGKPLPAPRGIHVMCTSNGSPYLNWQTRIMYRTFQKVQPGSDMLHFTRLLHRRTDDELMAEVPTTRVDSLHAACDKWCEFPVADRPDAIRKWLLTDDSKRGEWILMIETDYVWKKAVPMPPPDSPAIAFHFHYINPAYPSLPEVMKKLMPADKRDKIRIRDIPPTGPAPTIIRRKDLGKLMYERIAAEIEADPVAKQRLGWVREMYAYDLAAAIAGVEHRVEDPGTTTMIAQPPADSTIGRAAMYHYTWGADYLARDGTKKWSWDKRPYIDVKHVREPAKWKPPLPPENAGEQGYRLQDGKAVNKALNNILTDMLSTMHAAIDDLDELPNNPGCGWLDNEPACDFGCEAGVLCKPTKVWKASEGSRM